MNGCGSTAIERLVVVVRVTEACRLGCRFCSFSRDIARPRGEIDVRVLDCFGRILGEYQQRTGREVLVSWLGGEPFDWPPLSRMSERFAVEYGLTLSVTTNGVALGSESILDLLLTHFAELTVSVDGLESFHDSVRQTPRLFDTLRRHLKCLQQKDASQRLLRRVNTVLMWQNIESFETLCDELADWGIHEITFNTLGGNDRPEFFPEHRVRPEQMQALRAALPAMRDRLEVRGVRLSGSAAYLERLQAAAEDHAVPIADCRPGDSFLFVDTHGRVSPCSFTAREYGIELVEIDTVDALITLPQRFAQQRASCRSPWCENCPATHVFVKFATSSRLVTAPIQNGRQRV